MRSWWIIFAIPVVAFLAILVASLVPLLSARSDQRRAKQYAHDHGWSWSTTVYLPWLRWSSRIYGGSDIIEPATSVVTSTKQLVIAQDAIVGTLTGLKVTSFVMTHTKKRGAKALRHVVAVELPFSQPPVITSDYLLSEFLIDVPKDMDIFIDVNRAWDVLTEDQQDRVYMTLLSNIESRIADGAWPDPAIIVSTRHLVTWSPGRRHPEEITSLAQPLLDLVHEVPARMWDLQIG